MKLKSLAKTFIQKAFVQSHAFDVAQRFSAPSAVILMYHSVQDDPQQLADIIGPGIVHSTSIFRRQMEIIAREFAPVTLEDILLFLKGEATLPRRAVAVTFDDGFTDNIEIAAPVLSHFGIRAAFYITVALIGTSRLPWYCRLRYAFLKTNKTEWQDPRNGKRWSLCGPAARNAALLTAFDSCAHLVADSQEQTIRMIETNLETEAPSSKLPLMMTWDQMRRLKEDGHIVGSHTLTHPNLAHVANDDGDARRELVTSKAQTERALGSEIFHFSYPHPALNPQWSDRTIEMTAQAGYKTAVTTTPGRVVAGSNPLCLRRMAAPRPEHSFRWNLGRTFLGHEV